MAERDAAGVLERAMGAIRAEIGDNYAHAIPKLPEHIRELFEGGVEEYESPWNGIAYDWLPSRTRIDDPEAPDWAVAVLFGIRADGETARIAVAQGEGPSIRWFLSDEADMGDTDAAADALLSRFQPIEDSVVDLSALREAVGARG